jgi:transitional endoplasmic reticulum ATPase
MPIQLTVDRSIAEYKSSSRCLVYLDPAVMEEQQIHPGELIQVTTLRERSILARVGQPVPTDRAKKLIRLDRFLRQSTKTRLNDVVEIQKAKERPVKKAVLCPAIDVSEAHHILDHLKENFVENQTPLSIGSVLYSTFHNSVAGTTYKTVELEPGPGVITDETLIQLDTIESRTPEGVFDITFEDVGGLDREIKLIRELVQLPLQFPQVYRQIGINPPRGIILYGAPGSGKTHIARAMANEFQARFYYINGPSIVGTYTGETEANLRKIFGEATHHAPSIIFIDELDSVAHKRGESGSMTDVRMVTQLLSLLDGLQKVDGVIVFGTTNRLEAIDLAFRRPGRFDREIFIGPPNPEGRLDILHIHSREMPLSNEAIDYLPELAAKTHGFVGADIMELCREAGLNALRKSASALVDHLTAFRLQPENLSVTHADFDEALKHVKPSAIREALVSIPDVTWNDVGGLGPVKRKLRDIVEKTFGDPGSRLSGRTVSPRGVLLYGPSGTGKTLLAKAIANECKVNFLALDGPEIFSKWLGESEEGIRHIFRVARQLAPSIVFFDQLDALAPHRGINTGSKTTERVVSQLLSELEGIETMSNILVIGATNRVDLVDPSMLTPGRLRVHVFIPLPDEKGRREILTIHSRTMKIDPSTNPSELIDHLSHSTEGFSGAQLKAVCEEAEWLAFGEDEKSDGGITPEHFAQALERIKEIASHWPQGHQ